MSLGGKRPMRESSPGNLSGTVAVGAFCQNALPKTISYTSGVGYFLWRK